MTATCMGGFTHRTMRQATRLAPHPNTPGFYIPLCSDCAKAVYEGQATLSALLLPTHLLVQESDGESVSPHLARKMAGEL